MRDATAFWLLVAGLAIGTFLQRSVPIWAHGNVRAPRWLERLLRHVPAAAVTALVVPGSLYLKADGAYHLAPARTIAALAAGAVAWKSRNTLATLATGMVVLWVAQAVLARV